MTDSPAKKFFGGLLMAAGVLIGGLGGLCGGLFLFSLIGVGTRPNGGAVVASFLTPVIIFTVPPLVIGVLLFLAGRRMARGARNK